MKEGFVEPAAWTGDPEAVVRSETGAKLHIPVCPHIGGGVRLATEAERQSMETCSWCAKELSGQGRRYFDTLPDAMRDFKTYAGSEKAILAELEGVEWDQIWIPNSASYVALGLKARGVAWFGKTWVMPSKDGPFIELPGYAPSVGGGAPQEVSYGDVCEVHNETRSKTGVCQWCE